MNQSVTALIKAVPVRLNLALVVLVSALNLALWWLVPRSEAPVALWAAVSAAIVLLAPMHWALIHEAFHRMLVPRRTANDLLGRWLAVVFGAPFGILKFGHLFHHKHNRTPLDRTEHFDDEQPRALAAGLFYFRLTCGLFLGELFLGLMALLPARVLKPGIRRLVTASPPGFEPLAQQIEREVLNPRALATIRADTILTVAIFAFAFSAYGTLWWLFAVTLLLRGSVISILDNAFHYGGPLDDLHAAYNTRLPTPGARVVLNSNYHGVHHRFPKVPWIHLPALFAAATPAAPPAASPGHRAPSGFDGPYLPTVLAQFRGPIFGNTPHTDDVEDRPAAESAGPGT